MKEFKINDKATSKKDFNSIDDNVSKDDLNEGIRINKFLSESGATSRREADKLLEEGRIKVNGKVALIGIKVTDEDIVTLDDKVVERIEKHVYLAFNKPRGIETTTNEKVEDNIITYINYPKRIFPIGRLDKDSQGLILMTSDGDIVNKILRGSNNHDKEYIVTVNKTVEDSFIEGMKNGVPILGTITKKCEVEKLSTRTFKIILTQGLNRQIRRMCEYFGYKVTNLKRVRIMNIHIGSLEVGHIRELSPKERMELNELLTDSKKHFQ